MERMNLAPAVQQKVALSWTETLTPLLNPILSTFATLTNLKNPRNHHNPNNPKKKLPQQVLAAAPLPVKKLLPTDFQRFFLL